MARGVRNMVIVHVLLLLHYATWILDWYWCKILFITCCHDSLLDLMQNILCDVLVVITLYVMLWYPLLYVVGILLLSSYMCFDLHPFCAMLAGCSPCMFLYHTDRNLLIENSGYGISLRATPAWGHFSLNYYWEHLMQWPTPSWHKARRRSPFWTNSIINACVFRCWWLLCSSSFPHVDVFINVPLKINFNTSRK